MFTLKKTTLDERNHKKASYRAARMLEEDLTRKLVPGHEDLPEPEQPAAFCKRFGVKMNYIYLRNVVGARVDRYCWSKNAFLNFKKHASLNHLLKSLDYQEDVHLRNIQYAKKERAAKFKEQLEVL